MVEKGRVVKRCFLSRDNPQLYEINTVAWLCELSQRLGKRITLGDVPSEEWNKLKELGMDFVWLMGIWRRSPRGRRIFRNDPSSLQILNTVLPEWTEDDIIGSSYSIASYEPDPLVGNWQEIDQARAKLHQLSMGLILDFIPNHTGPDHPWVRKHPDYYIQGTAADYDKNPVAFFPTQHQGETLYIAKGRDPNYAPWSDTVQLNYFNPEARLAIIQQLEKIAQHCDGVRCDMAMLVLNGIFDKTWEWANKNSMYLPEQEFWTQAISRFPGLVWIAEAYQDTEWALQQLGFDYVYDKVLYDRLRWASAHDVYMHLTADITFQKKLLRFVENHDEPRSAEVFDKDRLTAAALVTATSLGMKLYFHGQFDGKRVRLPLQLRRAENEEIDKEIRAFYEKLLAITNQDIFHSGTWKLKEVLPVEWDNSFRNLIAYLWYSEKQMKIIIVNLSSDYAQGRVPLGCDLAADRDYILVDELNEQRYERVGKIMVHPGLHVILSGYRAHIFDVLPA